MKTIFFEKVKKFLKVCTLIFVLITIPSLASAGWFSDDIQGGFGKKLGGTYKNPVFEHRGGYFRIKNFTPNKAFSGNFEQKYWMHATVKTNKTYRIEAEVTGPDSCGPSWNKGSSLFALLSNTLEGKYGPNEAIKKSITKHDYGTWWHVKTYKYSDGDRTVLLKCTYWESGNESLSLSYVDKDLEELDDIEEKEMIRKKASSSMSTYDL